MLSLVSSGRLREAALASCFVISTAGLVAGQASAPPKPVAPAKGTAAAPDSKAQGPAAVARALADSQWTGDFDGMVKRRRIRILTPYSKTHYFIDKGVPRGVVYESAVKLEESLNARLKTTNATKLHVVVIPTSRDALYDALVQGRGDIVAAGITVTPEREKLVDFTVPTRTNIKQIVVTGPGAPALSTLDSLAGQEVAVRAKSIQFESLEQVNEAFKQQGKAPVRIRTVPTSLEDEDILEMANAGLLKAVAVDSYAAEFWKQILPSITPHPEIIVRDEGALAWAVRKNSPKLVAELNPIIKANAEGTLFGNVVLRKYLRDTKIVKSATSGADLGRFNDLVILFRKYAGQHNLDYLLMMAQGYQESGLDQSVKSQVGAIGVMQVMPATGKDMRVGDITQLDANIQAGVKYMRFMIDQYFKNEPMDPLNKGLFAFASYNAGPGRIRQLRRDAAARGLDPNVWFNNVERIAAEKIGRETVTYVSNIYKYYVAYTLVVQEMEEREKAKKGRGGA